MAVVVSMRVVMFVSVRVGPVVRQFARAAPQEHRPDPHNRKTRNNPENLRNPVRHDVARQKHGYEAENEHADRMRKRDHPAEERGVLRRALRTHQIRGNHRLSVTGFESVERAEPESQTDQRREQRP